MLDENSALKGGVSILNIQKSQTKGKRLFDKETLGSKNLKQTSAFIEVEYNLYLSNTNVFKVSRGKRKGFLILII